MSEWFSPQQLAGMPGLGSTVRAVQLRAKREGWTSQRRVVCQCYTQQVTRMHTTFEFCMDVVNNGYFDDTRMPPTYASGNSTRGLITSPSVDPATAIERGRAATSPTPGDAFSTRVTIVPDSSRMPRTL
ncbi:DNA-binding protein [Pseudomonas aeruginosa]